MKKIILCIAMLFAFGFTSQAQNTRFGVLAGVNFANLTGDVPDEATTRTGFHLGILQEMKLSEHFSIQTEVLYSQQGIKYDTTVDGVEVKSTWEFNYINIPIAAKYYVTEDFSIEAGPQIGYLLSAKIKMQADGYEDGESDIKSSTNAIEFGVIGGVAYDLPMGIFFQARYNAGLLNVNDDEDSVKNSVFQLSAGYKF